MNTRRILVATAVALALAAGAWLALPGLTSTPAPAVQYETLGGQSGTLEAMRGKVVLVNFWATSCVTCVKEMPELVATHDKFHPRGYETLAVAMSYDTPEFVSHFTRTRNLPFTVAFDRSGAIAKSFGDVQLTPTSVLINKRGEIVKRYVGQPDFAALHQLVEKLLAEA